MVCTGIAHGWRASGKTKVEAMFFVTISDNNSPNGTRTARISVPGVPFSGASTLNHRQRTLEPGKMPSK